MRHRQQLFRSINRILLLLYAPLSVALSVYYLFTGSLSHAMLSICTLFWLALPHIIHHALHFRIGQLLLFFYYIFVLLCYSGGTVLSFSRQILLYDRLMCFVSGFLLCIFAAVFFCCFTRQRPQKQNLRFSNLFCFCFSITVCVVWKLFRIIAMFLLFTTALDAYDIAFDLAFCLLGAAVYCCLTVLWVYKDIHSYPLYAVEDFAILNIKSTIEVLDK